MASVTISITVSRLSGAGPSTRSSGAPRRSISRCKRLGVAEAVADAAAPGRRDLRGFEESLEQPDAAQPHMRRGDVVDGERPAREGQHLVERVVGVRLAQQFQPGLLVLHRHRAFLPEDPARDR